MSAHIVLDINLSEVLERGGLPNTTSIIPIDPTEFEIKAALEETKQADLLILGLYY